MIEVVLHGELRQWSPGGRKQLRVAAAGKRAGDVVRDIGIPAAQTAAFVVNGEQTDADVVLAAGDTLEILPAISAPSPRPKRKAASNVAVAVAVEPKMCPSKRNQRSS